MNNSLLTQLFSQHIDSGKWALRELMRYPVTTLLTILAISLALSLPGLLITILENSQASIKPWQDGRQINVFLKLQVTDNQLTELASEWREDGDISQVRMITREQALEEFKLQSGLADALDLLEENPLPAVLVVTPADRIKSADEIKTIGKRLSADPNVDAVQIDQDWLQRLHDFITFLKTATWLLSLMFSLLVVLVINNSLRFEIAKRKNEIEVIKLIGGSHSFIQRPFLYTALFLGVSGALFAIILILLIINYLSPYLETLLQHYTETRSPLRLTPKVLWLIPLAGITLSILSTIIAVRINLRQVEPV